MTCTICPYYHECAETFRIGSYCHRYMGDRMLRICSITGELDYVGSDGMTKAERENHEAIKRIWQ